MKQGSSRYDSILWLNGRFLPAEEAAISPLDRGFLYGDGVFETMRCESGRVFFLDDHLQRLSASLDDFRIVPPAGLDWQFVITELISRNNLSDGVASVKIVVSRGVCQGYGLPASTSPSVCLTVQEYQPPESKVYRKGWRLKVFNSGFSTPLARHKSLNYLYFLMARQDALEDFADEALIIDPLGFVSETSAGSILARTEGIWWTPASDFQLPGITLKHVAKILDGKRKAVERRATSLDDLFSAKTVWVLNSLLGIMPVYEISGHLVSDPAASEAFELRVELFNCSNK